MQHQGHARTAPPVVTMHGHHLWSPPGPLQAEPEDAATLHVFMRGVMWRSAELNSARVWHQISQSWAVPFATVRHPGPDVPGSNAQTPTEQVTSHKGITDMAHELYGVIWPHIQRHQGPHRHLATSHCSFGSPRSFWSHSAPRGLPGCDGHAAVCLPCATMHAMPCRPDVVASAHPHLPDSHQHAVHQGHNPTRTPMPSLCYLLPMPATCAPSTPSSIASRPICMSPTTVLYAQAEPSADPSDRGAAPGQVSKHE